MSIITFALLRRAEDFHIQADFQDEATEHTSVIEKSIESKFILLASLQSFVTTQEKLDRQRFRMFVAPLLSRVHGLRALGWLPRVRDADRAIFEAAARRDGLRDFQITERDPQRQMVRASRREEYFPVLLMEPYRGNEPAFGFDTASCHIRRRSQDHARDTGEASATEPIDLVQDQAGQKGFAIHWAVYDRDARIDTVEARRRHLRGFAIGLFRVSSIVEEALGHLDPAGIDVHVFDTSDPAGTGALLYRQTSRLAQGDPDTGRPRSRSELRDMMHHMVAVDVGGRQWSIVCTPIPLFVQTRRTWYPWASLAAGLLLTGLLTAYLVKVGRAAQTLRESEARYQDLYDNAPDMFVSVDAKTGNILQCNNTVAAALGYSKEEMVGMSVFDVYHPDCMDQVEDLVQTFLRTGKVRGAELKLKRKDGGKIDVRSNVSAVRDEKGEILYSRSVWRDITGRKRGEDALRASQSRYRSLFTSIPSGFAHCRIVLDHNGNPVDFVYLEVNDAFEKLTGLKKGAVLGKRVTEAIPGTMESHPELFEIYGDVALTGRARTFDIHFEPLDIWLSIVVYRPVVGEFVAIFENITERKKAQQEREDLAKFPSEDPSPVLRVTADGHVLYANAATREILLSEEATDLVRAFPKWGPVLKKALRSGAQEELEEKLGGRTLSFVFAPVVAAGYVNVYGRDITKRKKAEEDLRQESSLRNTLLDNLPCIAMILKKGSREIVASNEVARRVGAVPGRTCYQTCAGRDDPCPFCLAPKVWATDEPQRLEVEYKDTYREGVWGPLTEDLYVHYIFDISDRKRTRRRLAKSREALRSLAARLQVVREDERTHLARKIHDDVGQALIGLKMDIAWLGRNITKAPDRPQAAKISERLESMAEALRETIQTIRDTASDLRPGLLDDVGLAATIAWQATQFETRTGVKCIFVGPDGDLGLDRDQTTALFRICQELLTNIAQHAGATTVRIVLTKSEGNITLDVSDDGKGIEDEQVTSSQSLGVLGMRERAHILGGEFSITGRPGKGTAATVRIPIPDAARQQGQQQDATSRP